MGEILTAGAHTLNVAFTSTDANYNNAADTASITVDKADQTITWATPGDIVYGTALGATQLNAAVSVIGPAPAGALTYTPAAGIILNRGLAQTLRVDAAATDNYNAASKTVTINVIYNFAGFTSPINMNVVNSAKAGQAIPVKWHLSGANGVISDPSSFLALRSYPVNCDTNVQIGDLIMEEPSPGSSDLIYKGNGDWQFNWKTQKPYNKNGGCRIMYVQFEGGQQSSMVEFTFK